MTEAVLIFPHQIYKDAKTYNKNRLHVLVEDPLYFEDIQYPISFHKQKLILHRASLKRLENEVLRKNKYKTLYVEHKKVQRPEELYTLLNKKGIHTIHVTDPTDYSLSKRIKKYTKKYKIKVVWYKTPNFLTSLNDLKNYKKSIGKKKPFFHKTFYEWQRKRLRILVDNDGNPEGGKWSFDEENRKKLPKGESPKLPIFFGNNEFVREAIEYVEKNWSTNPGFTLHPSNDSNKPIGTFIYPTNHHEAEEWLIDFLENRFTKFGPYEDAVSQQLPFIYHSVLTPMLNIGLLSPQKIIDSALQFSGRKDIFGQSIIKKQSNEIPLNSLEGFIRQIIGWREFIRFVYLEIGVEQRTNNFFKHTNTFTNKWYTGETGITPIDNEIRKINTYAYTHHIPRLMLLGNIMLLCEFNPDEVYKWFMEMFIDAYDWVMVPNVYGMSQFADGGKIVTKPYVSGSNYVIKMSDYSKSTKNETQSSLLNDKKTHWYELWDGLFWRFMKKHGEFLKKNARMGFLVSQVGKYEEKIKLADTFLNNLNKI